MEKPKHMSGAKGTGKKVLLDMGAIHEDFFADTALIGIVSSLPAYRFCWLLNRHFGLDLVRQPDLDICMSGEEGPQYFPIYQYAEPGSSFVYTIYKLKSNKEALLPEVRQLDYAWMIQSSDPEVDANNIVKQLRDIPDIQLAQVLQADKLKSINNLIV
ncbi:MAG: IPExxxVDY family protein [Bacteroidetes bacterium]|nr:IPExxxVDY family protein [Bacteroidota bacterium]